jgi:TonB-dependent SusC/RagA subfamily outer membrane receptor
VQVKGEDIAKLNTTSALTAMQSQSPGVNIVQTTGQTGDGFKVNIRGIGTVGDSAPLVIIDGVSGGDLNSLNPNDIESIEVLKDAASTAVYGTAGANGVLLITTKKGAMGKTNFTFSTKNSVKFEPKSMPMLDGNEYVAYMQDAFWNTANAQGLNNNGYLEQLFNKYEIGYQQDWRYFDEYNQNTDWLSYLTKNAFTTDNSFSMSGGGERATYRFSLSYLNEGGTTKGTGLSRLTTSIDIGYKFSEKLRVNAEYTYSDTKKDNPWTDNARAEALRKMPNKSPYYIDDATGEMTDIYFTRQNAEEFQGAFNGSKNFHPIIMVKDSYKNLNTKEQKMTVRANYYATPWLRYTGYVSMK